VLQAASEYGAAQFVMVSTDKAVLPVSIMGATKRLAELVLFAHPEKALERKAVRLGNVLGSSGSVGPIFLKQIMEGGPVTVTHPNARRFFLTLDHAVTLLLSALSPEYEAGILIPDLGPPRTVEELARYLIAATAREQQGIEIIFTGLRPGDKVEELSEGAIDDAVRNAVTKMSHVHFTSTEKARERIISMGEEPWRVHRAGAPSLDHLRRSKLCTRNELEIQLQLDLSKPSLIVAYHPVTIAHDTTYEASALFAALSERSEQILFCYPNADAGSRSLIEQSRRFLGARADGRIFVNLSAVVYWSLLANVDLMVGNSSSGIIASLRLPTVNVGLRQYGRERARNVLDAKADKQSILEKIEEARCNRFRSSLEGMTNPLLSSAYESARAP